MPERIRKLPPVGEWEIPAEIFRQDLAPPIHTPISAGVVLGESFADGIRAGNRFAGFRHTHIGWFGWDAPLEDARGNGADWIVRIDALDYLVVLVQRVDRGPVPGKLKAWLLRMGSFPGATP